MPQDTATTAKTQRYSLPFRLLHWLTALIILMMLIAGQQFAGEMAEADRIFSLTGHSSLGAMIVGLLILRVALRLTGLSGRPVQDIAPWQNFASKVVQAGIYLLMIYLPVTGLLVARNHPLPVQPFGGASISTPNLTSYEALRPLHEYGTKALMLLLVLHIGAALMHRLILRDRVMASMSLLRQRR